MAGGDPKLRYHCVSVVPAANSCAAAKQVAGLRLLSAEAPLLPLATCDRPGECDCRYRKYDDRREGQRRDTERGQVMQSWRGAERRRIGGRRATDV